MSPIDACIPDNVRSLLLFILVSTPLCLSATSTDEAVPPSCIFSRTAADTPSDTSSWLLSRRLNVKETAYDHVWPDLKFNWRIVLGIIIGFLGGSLGSVGGVGGGGIYVPMLTLIIGFDQKSSTALSKCMIMGASASTVWYNFMLTSPIIDYDLALIFQPIMVLGISIGVVFNVIFPNWLVTILLIALFTVASVKTANKAVSLWRKETFEKMLLEEQKSGKSSEAGLNNEHYEALEPVHLDDFKPTRSSRDWISLAALVFVWISFLILQMLKNNCTTCSGLYWFWSILQVPVAGSVFMKTAVSLYMQSKSTAQVDQDAFICAVHVRWTIPRLVYCLLAGLMAGVVGGLLGIGGGFIMGPLLLDFGVPPQVATATATFVMLFSSSMSVVEYYLLHRFPVPFALLLFSANLVAGFCGQHIIRKLIMLYGRESLIVFTLSSMIFVSAICLGGYGIQDAISKLKNQEYMGFLSLCT